MDKCIMHQPDKFIALLCIIVLPINVAITPEERFSLSPRLTHVRAYGALAPYQLVSEQGGVLATANGTPTGRIGPVPSGLLVRPG